MRLSVIGATLQSPPSRRWATRLRHEGGSTPDAPIPPEIIVPALTQAIEQILRRLRVEANPGDLNFSQTAAIAFLADNGGMTTVDLARAQAMKPQSMSTILASLEQEGLVKRSPHPTDGRQILFSLTDQGGEARRKRSTAKHEWLLMGGEALPG